MDPATTEAATQKLMTLMAAGKRVLIIGDINEAISTRNTYANSGEELYLLIANNVREPERLDIRQVFASYPSNRVTFLPTPYKRLFNMVDVNGPDDVMNIPPPLPEDGNTPTVVIVPPEAVGSEVEEDIAVNAARRGFLVGNGNYMSAVLREFAREVTTAVASPPVPLPPPVMGLVRPLLGGLFFAATCLTAFALCFKLKNK